MTPERVPFFYTLQHIEVYDIAETGDTSLRNLAQFLTNIKQRYTLKYYSNQLLHKLLENIHEGSFSQIQFSLVNGPLNNATFTNLRRINPDSIAIDGERMASTIDDNQTWPSNLRKLYLKQISSSMSPMMSVLPSQLQVLSISNVSCFSSEFFMENFVPTFSANATLVELSLILI